MVNSNKICMYVVLACFPRTVQRVLVMTNLQEQVWEIYRYRQKGDHVGAWSCLVSYACGDMQGLWPCFGVTVKEHFIVLTTVGKLNPPESTVDRVLFR